MLDTLLKEKVNPVLAIIAAKLDAVGIGPNQVSIYGFVIGFAGCIAIGVQNYNFGLFLILINRLLDGLDGAVARYHATKENTKSAAQKDFGMYLDLVLDKILFAAFICFYAMGQPHHAIAASFVLFSYVGLFSTSLGIFIFKGNDIAPKIKKPFYHPTRFIEETEITIFMILVCFFPVEFSAIAALFGIICWATTASRFWFSYSENR